MSPMLELAVYVAVAKLYVVIVDFYVAGCQHKLIGGLGKSHFSGHYDVFVRSDFEFP